MTSVVFGMGGEPDNREAVIKVIGVGGGGCNAVDNMIEAGIQGVEFICANTDAKALKRNKAPLIIQLGQSLTKGLGAGALPEVGRNAAMEDRERIAEALRGANMVFIAAGMGGGTGTGAAPVVAEITKELGILTVAVTTKPFRYEGKRMQTAEKGIQVLKECVDSLIVIPNEKLMEVLGEDVTMSEAFKEADSVLCGAVAGISEVITTPGIISVDFADVRTVMGQMGMAMMGSAVAAGVDRARQAAEQAVNSPLLDDITLEGAKGVLVNITTAPQRLKMKEYHDIMSIIQRYADEDASIKFGTAEQEGMPDDAIRVTLIATGLSEKKPAKQQNDVRVVRTGTDPAPATQTAFDPTPAVRRRRNSSGIKSDDSSPDFQDPNISDKYDIPAFIRRQTN